MRESCSRSSPHVALLASSIFVASFSHAQCSLSLTTQPADQTYCPSIPFVFSVGATGDGLFQFQWQWRRQGQTAWRNITPGINTDNVASFIAAAPRSAQTEISLYNEGHWAWMPLIGEFQCVISNGCTSVNSQIATSVVCAVDINCDQSVDLFDYLDFLQVFSIQAPAADFNLDGLIDLFDYLDFMIAFNEGC